MNICFIAKTILPTRTAESVFAMKMCQAYANLGHRVTLALPNWPGTLDTGINDPFSFYGVKRSFLIRRVPLPKWKQLSAIDHAVLAPLLGISSGADLIHARSLSAAWGSTRIFRRPTILEIHQTPSPNQRVRSMFRSVSESSYMRALVLITNSLANLVRPLLPPSAQVVVAPDGVDSQWLSSSTSGDQARARLGLANETRRIAVYTGHLYRGRGIELIVELAKRVPDHLFLIVGGREPDIDYYGRLSELLSNIRFAGFRPPSEIPDYLAAADVLLMPYESKVQTSGGGDTGAVTSPMKMFEYMASGRPVLASTLPVLQEVLRDGSNALLLPYERVDLWIDTLRRLSSNAELAESLGTQARSDVEQYTWENRARRLIEQSGVQ